MRHYLHSTTIAVAIILCNCFNSWALASDARGDTMKPELFAGLLLATATVLISGVPLSTRALAQGPLTICVEAPAGAANITAKRRATRTECSPSAARTNAILQARANASNALRGDCLNRISATERQATCGAQGLAPAPEQNSGMGLEFRSVPGGAAINAAIRISGRLCVVLRDVPSEFQSTTQSDAICVLDNFRRTIFIARSRAHCAVQCSF